jgi:hypothetical protein
MAKNRNLSESFSVTNRYAMHYGLLLGAFWVIRYLFLIVAGIGISDRFAFIFYLLNIVTLLIVYAFYYKFKMSDPDEPKGAWDCIIFTVMLCFYASFLEGAIMFAHYRFIDPAYFNRMIEPVMKSIEAAPEVGFPKSNYEYAKEITTAIFSNKLTYIIIEFVKNIFLGFFLSFVLNFVVKINKKS